MNSMWISSFQTYPVTQPLVTRVVAARPPRQYEFPTGFNTYFGPERFQVGEEFFYHSPQLVVRRQSIYHPLLLITEV